MSAYGSPCGVGSCAMRRESTTLPSDAVAVSSSGVSAVTLIVSERPASSLRSTSSRSAIRTSTSRADFLKPLSSAVTRYVPGIRNGAWKIPCSLVMTVTVVPMAALVMVMVAPGMMPPLVSRRVPAIVPRASCAAAGRGRATSVRTVKADVESVAVSRAAGTRRWPHCRVSRFIANPPPMLKYSNARRARRRRPKYKIYDCGITS